jgi:hydrogenase nickel incorporation protein HypB
VRRREGGLAFREEIMDVEVLEGIFDANEKIARENEELFRRHGVLAVNLMASPGAGKTSLVIRTLELLGGRLRIGVIEGDIASSVDSEKVKSHGVPVVQINTGGACHLDAIMIRQALDHLDLASLDLVIIENVGNLVCPAEFKLGEGLRAMILSVAEGHDKPLKYPLMFSESQALVVNKIDLLGLGDFDREELRRTIERMNPGMSVFELSCRTGEGLQAWADWLLERVSEFGKARG